MRDAKIFVLLMGLFRECQSQNSPETNALCAMEEFNLLTFDAGTSGKCADDNGTVVRSVWRGDFTNAECECQCLSGPKCLGYAYARISQACELHGPGRDAVV